MFKVGNVVTAPPRDRLIPGPRGVRRYVPSRAYHGYTLFSTAFGSTEYLIDMNGMVVHTWPVTHSQYAEILGNGHLMVDNYGNWLEELTPAGDRVWRWEGPYHHDFHITEEGAIVFLQARDEKPLPGFYPSGCAPDRMRTDVLVAIR